MCVRACVCVCMLEDACVCVVISNQGERMKPRSLKLVRQVNKLPNSISRWRLALRGPFALGAGWAEGRSGPAEGRGLGLGPNAWPLPWPRHQLPDRSADSVNEGKGTPAPTGSHVIHFRGRADDSLADDSLKQTTLTTLDTRADDSLADDGREQTTTVAQSLPTSSFRE